MLVEPYTTKFSKIGEQIFLRCDPKYRHFWDNKRGVSIDESKVAQFATKDILVPIAKTVVKKGQLDEERTLVDLEDVESRTGVILQERTVTEVGSDKLVFGDCDLVFGKLRPYLGKILVNVPSKKYVGTTEWIPLKLDQTRAKSAFIKYLLLLPVFLKSYSLLLSGKEHPRISSIDLRNMFIPLPSLDRQDETEKKIAPLEEKMLSLRHSLVKPIEIVNDVFSRQVGYDSIEYEKRASQNTYQKRVSVLDKSSLLRSGVKFHHPKYDYVEEMLRHYPLIKLKKLCAERIHRGVQPNYNSGGEVLVIKTLNLRNDYLDFTEAEHVTQEFLEANREGEVKRNDILVSSTGEGRGKIDIYDLDEPAIADSHVSIVRLKDDVNLGYVLYFMRSRLGKLQLETLEIAIKGTPEIYWHQLERLRIIDFPKVRQEAIVTEVRTRLQDLHDRKVALQKLRDEIDTIILERVTDS